MYLYIGGAYTLPSPGKHAYRGRLHLSTCSHLILHLSGQSLVLNRSQTIYVRSCNGCTCDAVQRPGRRRPRPPRRARISREDVRKAGFTIGCPGGRAINRNQPAENHTEECRKRLVGILKEQGDNRVERADKRIREEVERREERVCGLPRGRPT